MFSKKIYMKGVERWKSHFTHWTDEISPLSIVQVIPTRPSLNTTAKLYAQDRTTIKEGAMTNEATRSVLAFQQSHAAGVGKLAALVTVVL